MELKNFITKTLIDIRKGLNEANSAIDDNPYSLNSGSGAISPSIKFDIAVTVSDGTEGEGAGKINVFAANLGAKANFKLSHETVSRIQFEIEPGHD